MSSVSSAIWRAAEGAICRGLSHPRGGPSSPRARREDHPTARRSRTRPQKLSHRTLPLDTLRPHTAGGFEWALFWDRSKLEPRGHVDPASRISLPACGGTAGYPCRRAGYLCVPRVTFAYGVWISKKRAQNGHLARRRIRSVRLTIIILTGDSRQASNKISPINQAHETHEAT